MNNYKICLLVPYFGKWPVWFDFFMKSCQYNPELEFIFLTDCEKPKEHPSNIYFHKTSFDKFIKQVEDRLEITLNYNNHFWKEIIHELSGGY